MQNKFFQIIWKVKTQIILITLLTGIFLASHLALIPSPRDLTVLLSNYLSYYGLPLIAVVSFLENIVIFNVYFPGSVVVLTAMSLTAGDPARAVLTYLVVVLPIFVAHHINFLIGRYSNKQTAPQPFGEGKLFFLFFSTAWHPQLASVTSLAVGSEGIAYTRFVKYLFTVGFAWTIFWGFVMYFFGQIAGATNNLIIPYYIYLNLWLIWDLQKHTKELKNQRTEEHW